MKNLIKIAILSLGMLLAHAAFAEECDQFILTPLQGPNPLAPIDIGQGFYCVHEGSSPTPITNKPILYTQLPYFNPHVGDTIIAWMPHKYESQIITPLICGYELVPTNQIGQYGFFYQTFMAYFNQQESSNALECQK